jgi:hypothetical protein
MIALEVSRNGKRLCVAGVGDNGVVDAMVVWNGRPKQVAHPHLHVGGLHSATNLFVEWLDRTLRVGDQVTIRVVEVDESDPPKKTQLGLAAPSQKKKKK